MAQSTAANTMPGASSNMVKSLRARRSLAQQQLIQQALTQQSFGQPPFSPAAANFMVRTSSFLNQGIRDNMRETCIGGGYRRSVRNSIFSDETIIYLGAAFHAATA
jgi:hypothetical protein